MHKQHYTRGAALAQLLRERIVVLDGAMGTMIQRYRLGEADYRGARFRDHPKSLKGNGDVLQLTRPDVIEAILALDELMEASGERLPVIVSGTVTDASGRILSGQTVGAFWHSVRHARPLAIGLNCALGAALMRPYVEELARIAGDTFVSCYPNAGLPNPMSDTGFDETPEITGSLLEEFAKSGFLNIAGGCCGTTPAHIAEIAQRVGRYRPRCGHRGALFGELELQAA